MLFTSIDFVFFLTLVLLAYWFTADRSIRIQNFLLLAASYLFYASWDYRFLTLLIFSTALDYFGGKLVHGPGNYKRLWLSLVIGINVGLLFVFKYLNFFFESIAAGLGGLGLETHAWTIDLIIPLGISFYTFHGVSYVIDNYKGRILPEKSFIDYALFVTFFPLLIAGPIERATTLLPQLKRKRAFNYDMAVDGLRQILWGLFKKIVIADNMADYVNNVFANPHNSSGSTLVLGAILFSFQIYCDFSGYSDIALGTARLFGIELSKNFAFPYFAKSIPEFWRKWHISLTTWFKDYIYIPLGGSQGGRGKKIRNVFLIFIISGLWHGAGWTFLIWGILHATYFVVYEYFYKPKEYHSTGIRDDVNVLLLSDVLKTVFTFGLVTFTWIFFRSASVNDAFAYLKGILSDSLFTVPLLPSANLIVQLFLFILIEWIGKENNYAIEKMLFTTPRPVRWAFYYYLFFAIFFFSDTPEPFIYFQF